MRIKALIFVISNIKPASSLRIKSAMTLEVRASMV